MVLKPCFHGFGDLWPMALWGPVAPLALWPYGPLLPSKLFSGRTSSESAPKASTRAPALPADARGKLGGPRPDRLGFGLGGRWVVGGGEAVHGAWFMVHRPWTTVFPMLSFVSQCVSSCLIGLEYIGRPWERPTILSKSFAHTFCKQRCAGHFNISIKPAEAR